MKHPTSYLLDKIINSEDNGLSTLGKLDGSHVEDISSVIKSFAEEAIIECIDNLNKGVEVKIKEGVVLSIHPKMEIQQKLF